MATELGPTPVKKPASGGTEPHHAPKGVGEDNVIASQGKWASWLLAPTIIALAVVIVYPIISAIVMSFQADAGLDPATGLFTEGGPAGFSNYVNWLAQQCTVARRRHGGLPAGDPGFPVLVRDRHDLLLHRGDRGAGDRARLLDGHDHGPHLQGTQPGPRRRAGAVGHPHRRHRQAVAVHLRLRGHRQQALQHRPSCGPAASGRPSGRSSSPTSGRRRRSWRC